LREKWHINGQEPAKQVYKTWRKNHILGVGSLFKPHPVDALAVRRKRKMKVSSAYPSNPSF